MLTKLSNYEETKNIIEDWVNALESGRYKQGEDSLCRVNDDGSESYCCLGVLCEIAELKKEIRYDEYLNGTFVYYQNYRDTPPESLVNQLGLPSGEINYLIELNDNQKKSFQEIANYIKYLYKNKVAKQVTKVFVKQTHLQEKLIKYEYTDLVIVILQLFLEEKLNIIVY